MVCGQGAAAGWLLRIYDDVSPFLFNNTSAEFMELEGNWTQGSHEGAFAGDLLFAAPGTEESRAAWRVDTPIVPGSYEVYVWRFEHEHMQLMAPDASYRVGTANGAADLIYADQSTPGDEWIYLGTWEFDNSHPQGVVLRDSPNGYVIADAIKMVPVSR
jgi:hypothetical protein